VQLHEALSSFSQGQTRTAITHSKKVPFTGHDIGNQIFDKKAG
jgi:hypothetical protein